ncbi:MAG: class B sortase [Lachnospiraceae bacterium]|nr:class B sortase [Lachnospiraceae bacterium]
MTTGGWNVAGRQFRTRSDYEAACRDNKKIEKLKQSYNLEDSNRLRELNEELQSGKYSFETMVGEDFIYEIEQMTKLAKDIPAGKKTKKKHAVQKTEKQGRKKGKNFDEYDKNMQVEILWQLRQREKRRKWIIILCSLLAVTCFGYYGIYYYFVERTTDTYKEWAELKVTGSSATSEKPKQNYSFEEEVVEKEVLDEYKILYNKNRSLIGWVKIDDTIIDYPVMQTENNTYYLDHNVEQEYDKNGSIFLDKDCDVLKPSMNLIVYGHHMKSGKMFGGLDKYSQKSYYEEHPVIRFDTIYEKGLYAIMYVFRSRVYNEDEIVFKYYQFIEANSAEEFYSNMEEMSELSLYDTGITAQYGDQLLTLSTCDSSEPEGRFVIVARKIN